MKQYLLHKNKNLGNLTLDITPFASGGEGNIFYIRTPYSLSEEYIVKVFKDPTWDDLRAREKKALVLYHDADFFKEKNILHIEDMIYDTERNIFRGIVMPYFPGKRLLDYRPYHDEIGSWWSKTSSGLPKEIIQRIEILEQLVHTLKNCFSGTKYRMIDFKPENVIITPEGTPYLVDIDSIHIVDDNNEVWEGLVCSNRYAPPEYFNNKVDEFYVAKSFNWLYFSMAVIFYETLVGTHPFNVTLDLLHEGKPLIPNGCFAFTPKKEVYDTYNYMSIKHAFFLKLPQPIQNAFLQCFVEGEQSPDKRPDFNQWIAVFQSALAEDQ